MAFGARPRDRGDLQRVLGVYVGAVGVEEVEGFLDLLFLFLGELCSFLGLSELGLLVTGCHW